MPPVPGVTSNLLSNFISAIHESHDNFLETRGQRHRLMGNSSVGWAGAEGPGQGRRALGKTQEGARRQGGEGEGWHWTVDKPQKNQCHCPIPAAEAERSHVGFQGTTVCRRTAASRWELSMTYTPRARPVPHPLGRAPVCHCSEFIQAS